MTATQLVTVPRSRLSATARLAAPAGSTTRPNSRCKSRTAGSQSVLTDQDHFVDRRPHLHESLRDGDSYRIVSAAVSGRGRSCTPGPIATIGPSPVLPPCRLRSPDSPGAWRIHRPIPPINAPLPTGTITASIGWGHRQSSRAIVPAPSAIAGSRPSSMNLRPCCSAKRRASFLAASKSVPASRTSASKGLYPGHFPRVGGRGREEEEPPAAVGAAYPSLTEIPSRGRDQGLGQAPSMSEPVPGPRPLKERIGLTTPLCRAPETPVAGSVPHRRTGGYRGISSVSMHRLPRSVPGE